jgi:hypothetical protein
MWKNIVQSDRSQMTIWRMRFERWIAKATTHTLSYVTLIAIPLQQKLHKLALMLRYGLRTLSVLLGFRNRSPTSST